MKRDIARIIHVLCVTALLAAGLAGCDLLPQLQVAPTPAPTLTPPPTATLAPTLTPLPPTATPAPPTPIIAPTMTPNVGILDARFVSDITIPDGQVVRPGEAFTKIWELRNAGEVAWPDGTVLQRVGGPSFGPVESVTLRPRQPGETAEIAVDMVAPTEEGLHTSYWQLCVDTQCFGSRIWVQIRVRAEE